MRALTAEEILASFVNVEDPQRVPLPGLHETVWEDREYLGWRDATRPGRGYLVHETDEGVVVGVALRTTPAAPRAAVPAMCTLCRATQPATQVSLWSAAKASGDGGSVGTYICDDLGCPHIIRMLPPSSPWSPGAGDMLESRSRGLSARLASFTAAVIGESR